MTQSTDASNTTPQNLSLEGRLLAHRLILSKLLRRLQDDELDGLRDWLEERSLFQDGQEDPGAVPGTGLELELARADEFRLMKSLIDTSGPA